MSAAELVTLGIAGIACLTDLRSGRIPNSLTFGSVVLGLMFHGLAPTGAGMGAAALGLLTGLAVFFPVFALGAMGAGDVKLMAALGAWLGWYPVVHVALYGAFAGGVLALAISFAHGYTRHALANVRALLAHWWLVGVQPIPALTLEAGTGLRLPYALPILLGVVVMLWNG